MRILWLKTELLHPIDKGGKIRTYQMLRELKKEHHVTYLTLDDGSSNIDAHRLANEYSDKLVAIPHKTSRKRSVGFYAELAKNLFSKLPYFMQKYTSLQMRDEIVKLARPDNYDVVVCDFLMPAINLPDSLPIPTVLFQHNVEAMIWRRHYEVRKNAASKIYFKDQWRKTEQFERLACRRFDHIITVSAEDSAIHRKEYDVTNVTSISTGVDSDYFSPTGCNGREISDIVFTGSMDWLPNEDAVQWFVSEVFPLIRSRRPDTTFTIAGRDPSQSIRNLSNRDPSIRVTGSVPDIRPFLAGASLFIVPIRIGGGTRMKIYEAMAMELPVVSTSVGAEGLAVNDGTELLIRDDPESFAGAVCDLLADRSGSSELALRGARSVREKFGWNVIVRDFVSICNTAIDSFRIREAEPAVPTNFDK